MILLYFEPNGGYVSIRSPRNLEAEERVGHLNEVLVLRLFGWASLTAMLWSFERKRPGISRGLILVAHGYDRL